MKKGQKIFTAFEKCHSKCREYRKKSYSVNIYTCSKSTINTYCQLWTYFTPFSKVFIIDFEQINVSCVMIIKRKNPS